MEPSFFDRQGNFLKKLSPHFSKRFFPILGVLGWISLLRFPAGFFPTHFLGAAFDKPFEEENNTSDRIRIFFSFEGYNPVIKGWKSPHQRFHLQVEVFRIRYNGHVPRRHLGKGLESRS